MKVCGKCKIEKDESEFGKNKTTKDGLRCYCKKCEREWQLNSENCQKYLKSDKLKELKKISNKKYMKSEKYAICRKSEKYKSYMKQYRKSEKGKNILLNCNSTIKTYLNLKGVPTELIPQELIELKRIQLKIKRELKNGVQNENKN